MSALPDKYFPKTISPIRPAPKPRENAWEHPGFLQPLVQSMIQIKNSEAGRGVFAFTGPTQGVGVSYVTQVIARSLSLEADGRILIVSSSLLAGTTDEDLRHTLPGCVERAPHIWVALDDRLIEQLPVGLLNHVWLNVPANDFAYVLVDCPAVNKAGDALRVGPGVDAAFLVVAAGETTRAQIEHAQKLLRHASVRLEGIVLNRRTYPVPDLLYKLL